MFESIEDREWENDMEKWKKWGAIDDAVDYEDGKKAFSYDEKAFLLDDRKARSIEEEGRTWWLAQDVCRILKLRRPAESLQFVPEEDKDLFYASCLPAMGLKGARHCFVTAAGVFRLVWMSRIPEAVEFQEWTIRDLVPAKLLPAPQEAICGKPEEKPKPKPKPGKYQKINDEDPNPETEEWKWRVFACLCGWGRKRASWDHLLCENAEAAGIIRRGYSKAWRTMKTRERLIKRARSKKPVEFFDGDRLLLKINISILGLQFYFEKMGPEGENEYLSTGGGEKKRPAKGGTWLHLKCSFGAFLQKTLTVDFPGCFFPYAK
jgi:hypothetical protein